MGGIETMWWMLIAALLPALLIWTTDSVAITAAFYLANFAIVLSLAD
jgi:hypothetical protein